ncbi:hypothetical protein Tco_0501017 [Tanacetum coccineum]
MSTNNARTTADIEKMSTNKIGMTTDIESNPTMSDKAPDGKATNTDIENVTRKIVVMIGRKWDVSAVTGRYMSTDFVGNMVYCTTRSNVAHNFLRLKEGTIYSIKNFDVKPNKEEYRILKNDPIMVEFDGSTTIRKALVKAEGFMLLVNPFIAKLFLQSFNIFENRNQSIRVTLWDVLGDALIEKKTKHPGICPVVVTSVSAMFYNNKLYLSSSSSTMIFNNAEILTLKTSRIYKNSCVNPKDHSLLVDLSQPRVGML